MISLLANNIPISIIITSFNQGEYLEAALQSVFSQGYPDLECIVMDGSSQDASLEIIQRYADRLAWWESEPDRGQSHAINKGFARASGELITFMSSDDLYLPGALEDVALQYRQNPAAGAISGAFCFWDKGQPRPGEPIQPFLNGPSPCDLTLGPPAFYRLHQVATFYSRAALDTVGRFVREDMKYVMDRELLYRVCRRFPLTLSPVPYGVFRRHPESKSTADILPFAREFARLYLLAISGDSHKDRLRRIMAAYRLSRGYVKYAHIIKSPLRKVYFLMRAGLTCPELIVSRSYWRHYLEINLFD